MAREIKVNIVGDSRSYEKALGKASSTSSKFGKVAKTAFIGAGAAVAAGLGLSVKAAIDFESAFAGVRKTVEATPEQFKQLEAGIRNMAKEIPATATELSAIAEAAGQLGIKREGILGFTRVVADLGETTNLVGEEAAASLAKIANVMGTSAKDYDRLGSTIVALGNAGASTEADIVAMSLRIAGAGKTAGLSEADVLALANALSSVGIEAESGGSAISKVMIEIASKVAKGGTAVAEFAEVAGMSSQEFSKAFKDDAAGAIVTFVEGLGDIKKTGGDVFGVLEELGFTEVRTRDALLRAANAGDLFRKSLEMGSEAWRENTALGKEAAKRYETVAAKFEILRNNVVDIGISIGQVLLPPLSKAVQMLTKLIDNVRKADGLKAKVSIVFLGIKRIATNAWDALSDLITGTSQAKPLKLKSGKIVEFVGPMPGLADKIQQGIKDVDWASVGKEIGSHITTKVKVTAEWMNTILDEANRWVKSHTQDFAEIASEILLRIANTLTDPVFWAKNWDLILVLILSKFPGGAALGKLGVRMGTLLARGFGRALGPLIGRVVLRVIDEIGHQFRRLPAVVQEVARITASRFVAALQRIGGYLKGAFVQAWEAIPGLIRRALRLTAVIAFLQGVQNAFNRVKEAVTNMVNWIRDQLNRIPGMATAVRVAFFGILGPIQLIIAAVQRLIDWIGRIPSPGSIVGGIGSAIGGLLPEGATGGHITSGGIMRVHSGEDLVPARITRNAGTGSKSGTGRMEIALVAVGPDLLRQLRELDRRARLGGSLA